MSYTEQAGTTFEVTAGPTTSGLAGTIGYRIVDGTGAVVVARTTAGIFELTAGSGNYAVVIGPLTEGVYYIEWDTGGSTPIYSEPEQITVTPAAPSTAALCTLADVRTLLQKKPADTSQDALILSLIGSASAAIMGKLEREFAPALDGITRTFEWRWEGEFLSLAPYDLRAVTSIRVDTDQASPITLSTDEWRYWPQPPRDGTYMALRLRPFSAALGRNMWGNRQVQVTGDWGFPSIPADVTQGCAVTVVHWLTVNAAAFRRPDDNPDGYAPPKRGIPPEAWELFGRFKRASTV